MNDRINHRVVGTVSLIILVALSGLSTGCTGPTKRGKEARALANVKFNAVRSRVDYDQADQAFRSGNFIESKRHLEAAIDKSGEQSEYWTLLGRVYLETGALQDSLASFEEAERIDPKNADAQYFLGIIAERLDRPLEAVKYYLSALDLSPSSSKMLVAAVDVLIGAGMYREAEETLESHGVDFDHDAAVLHLMGRVAMMNEDWERAATHLEQSVLLDGEERWTLEDLARAQIGAGRTADALLTIDRLFEASDAGNEDRELLRLRGRCLIKGGRLREGRQSMLDLVNLYPEDVQGWIDFGLVCIQVEDFKRVLRSGQRLVVLEPQRFEGYFLLGQVAQRNRDYESALKLFARSNELASDRTEPLLAMAMCHELRGELATAYRIYANLVNDRPDDRRLRGRMTNVGADLDD